MSGEFKKNQSEFIEKVIEIDRISRTVKGGRRIRFRALVVIGNQKGKAGYGVAKGREVMDAITKAVNSAKKRLITIKLNEQQTIARPIRIKFGGARIVLKPAPKGASLVAGGPVRSVMEIFGIKNISAKSLGSANKINIIKAVFAALKKLAD